MPKSVPRLVMDKVRQMLKPVVLNSNVYVQLVPNKNMLSIALEGDDATCS